jgi:hypothetical protein
VWYILKYFSGIRFKHSAVIMGTCMARPQLEDRGDGLQMWRVAANTLNEQSRTAYKGWCYSLRDWEGG